MLGSDIWTTPQKAIIPAGFLVAAVAIQRRSGTAQGRTLGRSHTTALALRRAYPVPRRHGAPDFDLQYCDNALQYARSEHIIVISAMSSI